MESSTLQLQQKLNSLINELYFYKTVLTFFDSKSDGEYTDRKIEYFDELLRALINDSNRLRSNNITENQLDKVEADTNNFKVDFFKFVKLNKFFR